MNDKIRSMFPILVLRSGEIYFDNAATTHKPLSVINAEAEYYTKYNSNVHRGHHKLSMLSTDIYENARKAVAKFINAEPDEIIFTKGATESLNLVANSFCKMFSAPKNPAGLSAIVTTEQEHHSNICPFQMHCKDHPVDTVKFIEVDENGELKIEEFLESLRLDHRVVKLITITHMSNALGTVNDVKRVIGVAHQYDIPVVVDGAQAIAHMKVDVKDLQCDFYAFSGHKMYAPMGTGVLFGRKEFLDRMPPYQLGGGMITSVDHYQVEYKDAPEKFEAGTPNVAGVYGLHKAIDFLTSIGMDNIEAHERELVEYAVRKLRKNPNIKIVGNPQIGSLSFIVTGKNNEDVATFLNQNHIAVRDGYHCTHPLMIKMGLADGDKGGTVRASFGVYNSKREIDYFAAILEHMK